MPLSPGTRLGPYEIDGPLGAGGQGDIYAARDTRLGRDVAIKVLSEEYSQTAEHLERFRREAKTLASLNHPHICTLYDVGREGAIDFLVMERVEGETLAQRISRSRIPVEDVLKFGIQIADALDRAHRAGVVHRDLKPENVMLTKSGVKLLDFGLASAFRAAYAGQATRTKTAGPSRLGDTVTPAGFVVGTIPYMAPEQLGGDPADGRVDIWALGCVLYEMATRVRAFQGESSPEVISSILRDEPRAMSELAPLVPPALERAVRQCLAKDPDDRWQTAGDLRREIQWVADSGSRTGVPATLVRRRRTRERVAWVAAATLAIATTTLATIALRPKPKPKPMVFDVAAPPYLRPSKVDGMYEVDVPRISPDGRHVAFNAEDSLGVRSIWVRHMNSLEAVRLPGTENAKRCFWSPDSRFLAFFAGEKLYRVAIAGGSPITICEAPNGDLGSWGARDVIVFDHSFGDYPLQSVPASGGVPKAVLGKIGPNGESPSWPCFLPDGEHFLFITIAPMPSRASAATLWVGSIDSKEAKAIGPVGSAAIHASGFVLHARDGVLVAQKFDARSFAFTGEPIPIAEDVAWAEGNALLPKFSLSTEGTLVYKNDTAAGTRRLAWLDRNGKEAGSVGRPGKFISPSLSPDGTRLAAAVPRTPDGIRDIWIWDLERDIGTRFTFTSTDAGTPKWSPDGTRLAYCVVRGSFTDIRVKALEAGSPESILLRSEYRNYPNCWSGDGRSIAFSRTSRPDGSEDIWELNLDDSTRTRPLVATEADEFSARFSPNGTWLAYVSNQSGQYELYVRTIRGPAREWRISDAGGTEPQWRGDSREIYYLTKDNDMMAVTVSPGGLSPFSRPRLLFHAPIGSQWSGARYDVTNDGRRFLVVKVERRPTEPPTTVVLDWLASVRGR